jgi:Anti-sigma-K factor rskA
MSDTPSHNLNDEYLEELLTGYILNALSCADKVKLESYIEADPTLIQRLEELQEVMGLIAHSSQTPAPPQLRERVLNIPQRSALPMAIATPQYPIVPAPPVSVVTPRRSRLSWQKVGAGMAAALAVVVGTNFFLLDQQLSKIEAELTAAEGNLSEEDYTFDLKSNQMGSSAVAKVYVDIDENMVMIGVQNLPPLPPGEAYHLWGFTADQQQILCGRFNTDRAGQFVDRLSVPPGSYDSPVKFMRISREPIVPSSDPTKRVLVMTSES